MEVRLRIGVIVGMSFLSVACDHALHTSPTPVGRLSESRNPFVLTLMAPVTSIERAIPSQPGSSGVFRFQDGIGFFIYDFDHGLLSLHGSATLFTEICAGHTGPVFELVNFQTIETASGLQWMFKDEAHPVQIYPAVPFGCPSLAVTPRIAAGTARITRVDNDLFGDDRGMNASGWQASGALTDLANGGTVRYSEIVRVLFDPGSQDVKELQTQIRLQ